MKNLEVPHFHRNFALWSASGCFGRFTLPGITIEAFNNVCPVGHELRNFQTTLRQMTTRRLHGTYSIPKPFKVGFDIHTGVGYLSCLSFEWRAMRRPVTRGIGKG